MSLNVVERATALMVRMDVLLAVCFIIGAIVLPRVLRALFEVGSGRSKRAEKAVALSFADGDFAGVVRGAAKSDRSAATLGYEVLSLCKLGRQSEIGAAVDAALATADCLLTPSTLQHVLDALGEEKQEGSLMQEVVERFHARGVHLDDAAQNVYVDALDARGEDFRVEAVMMARPSAAARGYARLAAAALAREDLASAEASVSAMHRHGLFVPPHLSTAFLRRTLQCRGPRAALELVQGEKVQLCAEGLATVLGTCWASGDTDSLREAVAAARRHEVPMLLSAYESLVKGWAAAGGPEGYAEAIRYFDEMSTRGFDITGHGCASLLGACMSALPVARHILDAARAQGVATGEVYVATMQVLRAAGQMHEAAEWVTELEDLITYDPELLPGLVEACGEAGRFEVARDVLRNGKSRDPELYDRLLSACTKKPYEDWKALPAARTSAFATLQDAEDREVHLYPESYTRVQQALLRSGDSGAAAAMLTRSCDMGSADVESFNVSIEGSTWTELEGEVEPPVLDTMRRASLLPTTRTFGLLVRKAVEAENRAAAWGLVDMVESEGVGLSGGVITPLLASASGGELDRLVSVIGRDPESLSEMASALLGACLKGATVRALKAAVELVRSQELQLPDHVIAALVDAARNVDQVKELVGLVGGDGFPATRSAAATSLTAAGAIDEAVSLARAADDSSVYGALVTALLTRGDRERAVQVHDQVDGRLNISLAVRTALVGATAQGGDVNAAVRVFRSAIAAGHCLPAHTYELLAIAHCVAGEVAPARQLCGDLKERGLHRSKRLLSALLDAAARNGDQACADAVVEEMQEQGVAVTALTLASLVRLAGKQGDIKRAEACMQEMPLKHNFALTPQVHSAFARACAQSSDLPRAKAALDALQTPDVPAVTAVVLACLRASDVKQGLDVAIKSLDAGVALDPAVVMHLRDAGTKHPELSTLLARIPSAAAAPAPASVGRKPAQAWRARVQA